MAIDHGIHAVRSRSVPKFRQIMQDVEAAPSDPHSLGVGIAAGPTSDIDIAANGRDGRYPPQSVDDISSPDIAGMDDMRDAGEASLRLWSQKTVRIRDHTDAKHARTLGQVRDPEPQ